ncbi:MAG TPA: BACON domain-containing protein, partial [Vicinamibacterales bacterium]|nr:BACON domain-containing protein [Vicinamibacterales bacterium]
MGKCRRYAFLLTAANLASLLVACSETQTSTGISPSATQKCQFQVATSSSSFPDGGGTGTLSIGTTRDCTWAASSNASWVSLTNPTGQGDASISYTVAANTVPQTRVANLSVEGQAVQLSQAAAPCRYALSSSAESVGYAGGTLSVTIQTFTGCGWATSSDSGWLMVTSNASGN